MRSAVSGNDARPSATPKAPVRATWERLATANRPLFWLAAAAVFVANAVLSVTHGHWALAALQIVTGLLALVSAAVAAGTRTGNDFTPPVTGTPRTGDDVPEAPKDERR